MTRYKDGFLLSLHLCFEVRLFFLHLFSFTSIFMHSPFDFHVFSLLSEGNSIVA